MKKTYSVKLNYKDGREFKLVNIYRFESDFDMHGNPIFITFDDVKPIHFDLVDGMTIEITEENVEKP